LSFERSIRSGKAARRAPARITPMLAFSPSGHWTADIGSPPNALHDLGRAGGGPVLQGGADRFRRTGVAESSGHAQENVRGVVEAQAHEIQREHVEQSIEHALRDGGRVEALPRFGQKAQALDVAMKLFQNLIFRPSGA
jgi:hypothetical protein